MLSDSCRRNGDADKANEYLLQVFANKDGNVKNKVDILAMLSANIRNEEDRTLALDLGNQLVKIHPDKAGPHNVYADLLLRVGDKDKALASYLKAAEIDGSNFNVWRNILSLEYENGLYQDVIDHAEEALELFPNQGYLYLMQGSAQLVVKEYEDAVFAFEQSKKMLSGNRELVTTINAQLGDAYHGLKQYQQSDESYEAALNADPNNDHVLNNYSYYLSLRKEKLSKAKEMSAKLVQRNPNNATFLDTYAWVLYMLEDYENAKKNLEKALEDEGASSAVMYDHYGDILFKLGEVDQAVQNWEKAKTLDATLQNIDKKIADRKLYE